MLVAAVLLGGLYILPLWGIGLVAPQYPEGLGMVIRLGTIAGAEPHDLDNINELNHYIGMKVIDPGSIPELRVMPWIVGATIAAAVGIALVGTRRHVAGWLIALTVLGAAGLVDFWRWTYDFGHNLDMEHAIIQVPGTVYQPPIFGSKQILNFTATSWPQAGAWLAFAAAVAGAAAWWFARSRLRPPVTQGSTERTAVAALPVIPAH